MAKYFLHGSLVAVAGKGQQLSAILLEAAELMSAVEGCRAYVVSQLPGSPDRVWITEIWESKKHHDRSLQMPDVGVLLRALCPLLASPPELGQELEILGGKHS